MKTIKNTARFSLGSLYFTSGAYEAFEEAKEKGHPLTETAFSLFSRHQSGDWGDLDEQDKQANEMAVEQGDRILSAYKLKATGQKLWVITEADRSATTILRPDEY